MSDKFARSSILLWMIPVLHAVNDCIGGYLMASYSGANIALLFLIFNVVAFGAQLPAGFIVDRYLRPIVGLRAALALSAAGIVVHEFYASFGLIICAVASCLFHVSGGSLVLSQTAEKDTSSWLGAFTAPGVLGLALGGMAGHLQWPWLYPLLLVSLVFLLLSFFVRIEKSKKPPYKKPTSDSLIERHDLVMMIILLVIAFRSATWNIFQLIYYHDLHGLLLIAISACSGKLIGGYILRWIPPRLYLIGSSILSTLLLSLGARNFYATLIGIFFLQSVTPVMFLSMHRLMPEKTATSSALVLGTAIALGAFSTLLIPDVLTFAGLGLTCLLLYLLLPSRIFR